MLILLQIWTQHEFFLRGPY